MPSIDVVYMLVKRGPPDSLWYSPPATNLSECWERAAQTEWPFTEPSKEKTAEFRTRMKRNGWRAEKVRIERAWP